MKETFDRNNIQHLPVVFRGSDKNSDEQDEDKIDYIVKVVNISSSTCLPKAFQEKDILNFSLKEAVKLT
jgi:hypothetical protein